MEFFNKTNTDPVHLKTGSIRSATGSVRFIQGYRDLISFINGIGDSAISAIIDSAGFADRKNSPDSGEIINDLAVVCDLGLADYKKIFDLQKRIVSIKINNRKIPDIILILEHFPVFTLGKRGGRENIIVSEELLKSRGIPIVQTERGGNITFHGPGQLILYPIVDLERVKKGVADFVYELEGIMIQTAAHFGVKSERNEKNHGVWVKNAKIGSIGLSIKKGVSFHGLAFNVDMDLEPFSWINPCGMSDISMTSLKNELLGGDSLLKGIAGTLSDSVAWPNFEQAKEELLNNFFGIAVPYF